jgi:hypothetical protein
MGGDGHYILNFSFVHMYFEKFSYHSEKNSSFIRLTATKTIIIVAVRVMKGF